MPPENSEHDQEKVERLRRAMYSRALSDKLGARSRRDLDSGEAVVPDDFRNPEPGAAPAVVAPRAIGVARVVLWWLLGIAVVFFIGAGGFFAYYFTFGGGSPNASSSNIDITVAGPPQVESGSVTEFLISVTNRNPVTLQLADLILTYPPGTRSAVDYTTNVPSDRVSLGVINPGETRQGKVPIVLSGIAGTHADVKVELEYRIPGSNAIFVASSAYNITFGTSPISISVEGNKETIAGQPVQFDVSVSSNASAPVADVLMSAGYPFGFTQTSAEPRSATPGLWELGTFAPGQKKNITIRGTLAGEEGDERVFRFIAGTRASSSANAITTPLSQSAFTMTVSKPFLGLAVSVNGASDRRIVVSPGEAVTVAISWQNNLPLAISNAAIIARLTGIVIDGSTVKSADGFYRSADGVVIWDKTTNKSFASIAANARGTVSFSFTMPSSEDLRGILNPQLDISINAAGNRLSETGVPQNMQATTDQKIAIASDVQAQAQGLYYSNPFGSSGPIPAKAGVETTYAIVFTVTNTTNKITGAALAAVFPPYVRWVGIYSPDTEDIYFDGKRYAGGQVLAPPAGDPCQGVMGMCWSLGDIEPGAGLNGTQPRQAVIAIGFTPSSSQIGQKPPLLQDMEFSGTDDATDASIKKSISDVTTNIVGDPGFSAANAEVVK
ncbi:MAG: hypothetical protein NUV59_00910 [Patescibacteria group bacterium]|nr:hypothetical protein [Patescibacteria group bacterium]